MKLRKQQTEKRDSREYRQLEPRNLLAGISFDSSTGVISIDGSEDADAVRIVNASATQISVVFTGVESRTFSTSQVASVVFVARGGDDWFRNDTAVDAVVYGQLGADRLIGGSGNDRLRGGPGNDRLVGNAGNDWLAGDEGDDIATGDNGNDTIFGSGGNDYLSGGYGDDLISGEDGDDLILGEGGFDDLRGDQGHDRIFGGNAHDRISGGGGDDELFGDDGMDLILAEGGNDIVYGGNQNDSIYGYAGNDTLHGGNQNDLINGGPGSDRLFGQIGFDWLYGYDGNDILHGGAEADLLVGGTGNDDFYEEASDHRLGDPEDDDSENDDVYLRSGLLSNRLTLSFAPDGTSIFGQANQLFSAFSAILTPMEIEETLIRSFGIWAVNGNLDVGLVSDSGAPFGTSGLAIGDPRFGDVRIGAVPLAADVYAVALGRGDVVSGTWAGDILFNSNAVFESAEHFFTVALHEVGHALGLKHVLNIDSTMHRYSNRTDLSPLDIANFQGLYGLRQLDQYDLDELQNNDSFENATNIGFEDHNVEPGVYPSVLTGDIHNTTDRDFFRLRIPDDYSGAVTFQVVSDGISLFAPDVSLYSENRSLIHHAFSSSDRGDILSYTFTPAAGNRDYFIKINGGNAQSLGSFALITSLDGRNTVPSETVMEVARDQEFSRLDERDLAEYFADPDNYLLGDDQHSDDDFDFAMELEDEDGYAAFSRFHRKASLADNTDVDIYKFESTSFSGSAPPLLNISVRSVEIGGMIPKVTVFDATRNPVASQVVVNGRGEYAVQVSVIESAAEYYVHVGTDNLLPFQSGSYELTVYYSSEPVVFVTHAQGTASVSQKQYHSLHVAESQVMQFGLEAAAWPNSSSALLWATVYNEAGEIVYQSATRADERRTSGAVYLAPGSYTIEIETLQAAMNGIAYKLIGVTVGDGQGPTFSDSTSSPFPKTPSGNYVYPDDVITDSTFVFVDGTASNLPPPPVDQPPGNLFNWYWGV